ANPQEYLFIHIISNTTAQIVARGQLGTAPLSLTTGFHILEAATSGHNDLLQLFGIASVNTDYFLMNFIVNHGSFYATANTQGGTNRVAYISHNTAADYFMADSYPGMTMYYEDATAFGQVTGSCNTFMLPQSWDTCDGNVPLGNTITGN